VSSEEQAQVEPERLGVADAAGQLGDLKALQRRRKLHTRVGEDQERDTRSDDESDLEDRP
jgi:hypothetical protein